MTNGRKTLNTDPDEETVIAAWPWICELCGVIRDPSSITPYSDTDETLLCRACAREHGSDEFA